MSKKILISVIAMVALFAASFPATAAEEEEKKEKPVVVPDQPEVSDPPGDANAWGGDWQTGNAPVDGADIRKIWFSNDAETISAHIQTTTAPANDVGLLYRVYVNPNNALASTTTTNCIRFEAGIDGLGNLNGDFGRVNDACGESAKLTDGKVAYEELPDGSGVITITVPRTASPKFEQDSILFVPWGESRQYVGVLVSLLDNTKPGSDYTVRGKLVAPKKEEPAEGEEGEEPEEGEEGEEGEEEEGEEEPEEEEGEEGEEEEEEPEQSEPPAPKKAKKGKGCPPMTPHEKGAEAETTVVTEEATEEKPIEVPVEAPPGLWPASTGDVYQNIQVDTAGGEAGLFVRYEFPEYEDLDLYLYEAGNDEAVAQAAGFNQFPFVPGETDGTGNGGHSEMGAEQIDGFAVADCAGYTAEMHSFLSQGGEYTLKIWLGEPAKE